MIKEHVKCSLINNYYQTISINRKYSLRQKPFWSNFIKLTTVLERQAPHIHARPRQDFRHIFFFSNCVRKKKCITESTNKKYSLRQIAVDIISLSPLKAIFNTLITACFSSLFLIYNLRHASKVYRLIDMTLFFYNWNFLLKTGHIDPAFCYGLILFVIMLL